MLDRTLSFLHQTFYHDDQTINLNFPAAKHSFNCDDQQFFFVLSPSAQLTPRKAKQTIIKHSINFQCQVSQLRVNSDLSHIPRLIQEIMGQIEIDESVEHSAIDELPAEVYRQAFKDIVKNNVSTSIENCSVTIDSASAKGDNYIGVLYRACVKDPEDKELKVIIKLPPQNVARREQFFARPCFLRESEFYDTVYPMFKKFQESKGIDVAKDGFYQIPVCYKSLTEDCLEGLFMEDLKVTGFEMFDRFKDATVDHVNQVMRVLGKLHAISLAMKDQTQLVEPYKGMQDIFLQRDDASKENIKVWFEMLKKQAIESLNLCESEDLKSKANAVLEGDFFEILLSCIDGVAAEPYTVISHGDCWNNNVMFRYEVRNFSLLEELCI